MADPKINMNMPLDMTIEIDGKCDDYQLSLVIDPTFAKELKKDKKGDFKEFLFEGKKFEYDKDEGPISEDEAGDYGDYGDEAYGDEYGDEGNDDDYYRR